MTFTEEELRHELSKVIPFALFEREWRLMDDGKCTDREIKESKAELRAEIEEHIDESLSASRVIPETPTERLDRLIKWWGNQENPSGFEFEHGNTLDCDVHYKQLFMDCTHFRRSPNEPWQELPKKEGE